MNAVVEELSSSMEDYLEAIYLLAKKEDEIGTSDIASFLGVKLPSVTEMLKKLREKDLVIYEKYGRISLTTEGEKIARGIYHKHTDLASFLELLGVDRKSANLDACKIEHVVNSKTMEKLRKFLEFIKKGPKKLIWLEHYNYFVKTGKHPECDRR